MRNKLFYLLILFVGLLSLKLLFSIPTIFLDSQFDGQNLIVWKYAASTKMLPYKEVFYPYGILNYFVNVNFTVTLINAFIFLLLLVGFLMCIVQVFKKSFYGYFVFSLFLGVILFVSGVSSFLRYGLAVLGALSLSLVLYNKKLNKKIAFFYGLVSGVFAFLVTDQGVYLSLFFTLFFWIDRIFKQKRKFLSIQNVKSYLIFLLGVMLGLLPFALYYLHLNILNDFVVHFFRTPDISLYAKTPYFHSLKSNSGVFTVIVLFSSISYLSYAFFQKKPITKSFYALFALTVVFFVIEQKGIIRYLGQQIIFLPVLMGFVLLFELFSKRILRLERAFKYLSSVFVSGLLLYFILNPLPGYSQKLVLDYKFANVDYSQVVARIRTDKYSNGKLFSLPSDPILYIVNKQKPPYFFTVYDGSPKYAQNMSINYIKQSNIKYVIYNSAITSIQDGVPDYLRAPNLFKYILNNFYPASKIGTFVILKLGSVDFFDPKLSSKFADIQKYFLEVDLGSIPYSEGYYKKNLFNGDLFVLVGNSSEMSIPSRNKFLLVYFKNDKKGNSIITIHTKDDLKTQIFFESCAADFPCVINLSNIPLFYKNRSISGITFDKNSINQLRITTHKDMSGFW